ncbi:MAG: hypothetical protein KDE54_32435, partial [Caldilineaceae bacterium]|nr:hypothetical protein [Caldilineaceae bacterium]
LISTVVREASAPLGQSFSTLVMPDSASSLHATMGTLDIQMSIMTGTVSQPISLTVRSADSASLPNGFAALGVPFMVEAYDLSGTALAALSFDVPIATTISYAAEVGGLEGSAGGITLQYYDEPTQTWLMLPTVVDIKKSTLQSAIGQTGVHAVLLATPTHLDDKDEPILDRSLYLPLINIK